MATIQGGTISFEALWESGSIERGLKTTEQLIKNFTSLTAKSGANVDAEYQKMAAGIQSGFEKVGNTIRINEVAIDKLKERFKELGIAAGASYAQRVGGGGHYTAEQVAIQKEIDERKKVIATLNEQDAALLKLNSRLEEQKTKTDNATGAQARFRTQILNVKNEMMTLEQAGKKNTAEYARLVEEAKRLQSAMYAANQQVKILTSTKGAMLQGIVSGVSGLSGAFTAAQGAMGLFADKNEDLQKIMLKVHSLMSITMGLQAVSAALHQTSAFRLVVLTKAQAAYSAAILATGKALIRFGFSANAARIAARAFMGAVTLGLGVAITGVIMLISKFTSKQNEAKKATEEFYKSVAENAGKPVGIIKRLQFEWNKLGDDLQAKEKFIKDNKKSFEELGWALKDVADAEKVLSDPKNVQAFIDAQIAKAKAMAMVKKSDDDVDKLIDAEQKLEVAKKTPKVTRHISVGTYGAGYSNEIDNPEIAKWENKVKELNAKIEDNYKMAAEYEKEGMGKLKEANVESIKDYADGTVGALEAAIEKEKTALELLKGDNKAYKEKLKQIEDLEEKLNAITGKKKEKKEKDPVLQELEEKKKAYQEYFKWVNSTDEIVRSSASKTFSELLKGGSSYREYLSEQISVLRELQNEGTITGEQLKKLHTLTTALQDETDKNVMKEFEKSLQAELNAARSILDMLNIIEQKRKALETDDSGLKEQKTTVLDKQQENVVKKAEDETSQLLKDYSDYLDRKIKASVSYDSQMQLLRDRAAKAETEEEKKKINDLIALSKKMHDAQIDSFEDLERINIDSIYRYGTFEQKKLQIVKEYNKLIEAARIEGHEDIAKKLEGERDLEISKETKQYKEFFGDISEISIKTLENTRKSLLAMMKEAYEAGKLTAEQYKQLINEINRQADSAHKGRGIESLFGNSKTGGFMNMMFGEGDLEGKISSFKNLFSGAKGDMASMAGTSGEVAGNAGKAAGAMQGAAGGAVGTLAIIDAIIKSVYQTLRAVSDTLNTIAEYQDSIGKSDAADSLGDWADAINSVNETAMSGWENLKNGNVMGAISDTISMPFKLLTTLNKIHDKKIEKQIQAHADAVRDLTSAYNQLSWAIKNALGEIVYKNQTAAIQNMREQQARLQQMWKAEEDKKKTDNGRVSEFKEQYAELERQIEGTITEISNSITQTTAKDLSNQLADALVEAYGKGEDAAKSFEEVSRQVMQNAVKNALKLQYLDIPLKSAIDRLQKDMGFDSEGNGTFDGLTKAEQDRFKNEVARISAEYDKAMKIYEDLFNDLGDPTTTLSGAIKGASQESINLLAGQTNAVRVNQVQSIEILRNSLIQLTMIRANTSTANKYLEQIEKNTSSVYDPLRSQGITGG